MVKDITEILKRDKVVCYHLLERTCKEESCFGENIKCGNYAPFHTADYRRLLELKAKEAERKVQLC
jgi:hypothetical protein